MANDACCAHEDEPKWENSGQLAMYEKVEYGGGDCRASSGATQKFQKGDKLLASLSPGKSLKPHSNRIQTSTMRHDEMWGEVHTCCSSVIRILPTYPSLIWSGS